MGSAGRRAPEAKAARTRRTLAFGAAALALALGGVFLLCDGERSSPGAPEPAASPAGERAPGALPFDPELAARLVQAWASRPADYMPRTRHLDPQGAPKYTNRLFLESSPYLRQHAHNPVDWHPWGEEAFELARRLGRPVLLSVGYSTCHWCHVMEEESFDDEEIARYINENYVAIKVDREERPDVDAIYMAAVQALAGRGGWPMTVWLTPNREPFFAGTYFPARDGDRGTRTGFLTLLGKMREDYARAPDRVVASAARIAASIRASLVPEVGTDLPAAPDIDLAVASYERRFDPSFGGLGRAPKFPSSLPIRLLLRHHARTGEAKSLEMAATTLEKMAAGGLYDQVGGGFHRYATDARWLVPHFEKMLYDQALLVLAYLDAYQATGRADFASVARETLRYVARDMTSPDGGFYSATDADSADEKGERAEGHFFTWTPAELDEALGAEDARVVAAHFGVRPGGNFEGRSILHVASPLDEVARRLGLPEERALAIVHGAKATLYEARKKRAAPLRDEKILASWNGLMIGAFARAALVLGEEQDAEHAARAADFVLGRMRRGERLLRSSTRGEAKIPGYLDDYAFMAEGLLSLFEATGEVRWLREAVALDGVLAESFEDPAGGFFRTSDEHERLLAREKPSHDGAEPSGNSVAILNLLRLSALTGEDRYRARAERALRSFGEGLRRSPTSRSEMLLAVEFFAGRPKQVVVVSPPGHAGARPLWRKLGETFVPNAVVVPLDDGPGRQALEAVVPLVRGKDARGGLPTAYVCEAGSCKYPTTDPETFAAQLVEGGGAARR